MDAEVIADGGGGDPLGVLAELEGACGGGVVVAEGKMQGQEKGDEGDGERTPLHQFAPVGQQSQQDRAREGDEGDDGQDGVVDVHRFLLVKRLLVERKLQVQKQILRDVK